MSESYLYPATSISSSGHTDGLGRRELCFDRETGAMLERLHVRPELAAFEAAIRERVERLATFENPHFARTCSAERTSPSGELTVVSEFLSGIRLADLLETSREETLVPGVDAALGYLAEALSALGALHLVAGFPHGLIAPERTIFTAEGRLVFLDPVYAAVVDRLGLSRRRLWTEFGIAAAPAAGPARLDAAADLSQAALSAVMLILGRSLEDSDYPDNVPALLMEVVEVAQIRGGAALASDLRRLLQRMLPLPGRRPYGTAEEALTDLRQLLRREIGLDACRKALADFVRPFTPQSDSSPLEISHPDDDLTDEIDEANGGADLRAQAESREEESRQEVSLQEASEDDASVVEFELDLDEHSEPGLHASDQEDDGFYDLFASDLMDLGEFATTDHRPAVVSDALDQNPAAFDVSSDASTAFEPEALELGLDEPMAFEVLFDGWLPPSSDKVAAGLDEQVIPEPAADAIAAADASPAIDEAPAADPSGSVGADVATPAESSIAADRPIDDTRTTADVPPEADRVGAADPSIDTAIDTPPEDPAIAGTASDDSGGGGVATMPVAEAGRLRDDRVDEPERQQAALEQGLEADLPGHVDSSPHGGPSSKSGGHRRKQHQQKSARSRKDKLRSTTTRPDVVGAPDPPPIPQAAAQTAPAPSKSGWLIPQDAHSTYDTIAPEPMSKRFEQPNVLMPAMAAAPPPPAPFPSTSEPIVSYQQPVAPLPAARGFPLLPSLGAPTPRFGTPKGVRTPAAAPSAAGPITLEPVARLSAVKIKAEPPAGYVPTPKSRRGGREGVQSLDPVAQLPPTFTRSTFQEQSASRGFPWKLVLAAVVIVAAAVVGGRAYLPGGVFGKAPVEATPATAAGQFPELKRGASPSGTGQIVVKTDPAGVRILIDGKPAGESPLTLDAIPAGRHVLTFVSSSGSVKRTVRVVAGKSMTLDLPIFSGWVSVLAPFVVDVAEDGKSLGTTEQGRLMLAPGPHHLSLTNADLGYRVERDVEVTAGAVSSVRLDPKGLANFNAIPWAEVWSDGHKVGDTPIANHTLPLGSQDFIFKHPQFGERKLSATIRTGQPAAVVVDFTRPQQP